MAASFLPIFPTCSHTHRAVLRCPLPRHSLGLRLRLDVAESRSCRWPGRGTFVCRTRPERQPQLGSYNDPNLPPSFPPNYSACPRNPELFLKPRNRLLRVTEANLSFYAGPYRPAWLSTSLSLLSAGDQLPPGSAPAPHSNCPPVLQAVLQHRPFARGISPSNQTDQPHVSRAARDPSKFDPSPQPTVTSCRASSPARQLMSSAHHRASKLLIVPVGGRRLLRLETRLPHSRSRPPATACREPVLERLYGASPDLFSRRFNLPFGIGATVSLALPAIGDQPPPPGLDVE